ncbi:uncharacterized protein LOC108913604 [Anoplophora glabripennis]|uniref:uncharacterized protein LOC108913604 n=1 Tax=Anoplophora glabripennis TaxID=217634 RepID=UPI00087540B2|nr:uncharacterized protein LOC108913604 [Anoplophora glabripennis]
MDNVRIPEAILIAEEDGIDLGLIVDRAVNLLEPIRHHEILEEGRELELRIRNKQFFEVTIPSYNDDLFKEHFRMSRRAFQNLVNILGRIVDHEHDKIDFGKKVLFTIWTISKPESFLETDLILEKALPMQFLKKLLQL